VRKRGFREKRRRGIIREEEAYPSLQCLQAGDMQWVECLFEQLLGYGAKVLFCDSLALK
jgi:hypothetical protein